MGKDKSIIQECREENLDESYYNAEKGWERFKETLDVRMRTQDEMRRFLNGEVTLADYPDDDDEPIKLSLYEKFSLFLTSKSFRKIATVFSLVLVLFVGGVAGAYAQREGFLGNIVDNEEKNFILATPTFSNKQMVYDNIKNVPLKYISCLWTPTNIPEEIELKTVILIETEETIKTKCEYKNKINNKFIVALKNNYKDSTVLTDKLHDGFEAYKKESYDGILVKYMIKENDDYTEFIASFIYDNCVYNLNSNLSFDVIEDIIQKSFSNLNL